LPDDGVNGIVRQMSTGRGVGQSRTAERRAEWWRGFAHGGRPGACRAATPPTPRRWEAGEAQAHHV